MIYIERNEVSPQHSLQNNIYLFFIDFISSEQKKTKTRAQQVERQNLSSVTESEKQKESVKSPPLFKSKASPKAGFLLSALKKENRSRSNSSVVMQPRRYSTDSILGDRMDSIGRRLSRDLTNSPPDLGKRYESFGKSGNKYETVSGGRIASLGISKSNETISDPYDSVFSGKSNDKPQQQPSIAVKLKKAGKRPKISFESYHRDKIDGNQLDKSDSEHELSQKEGLEPPILLKDRPAAILRYKLHKELRSKYPPIQTKATNEKMPNSVDRPPLPKKIIKHQRQKSLDNLDVENNGANKLKTSPQSDSSSGSLTKVNQRSQISLERLSREDLLRLSHSSQSEIHEYLKNSMPDRSVDTP